MWDSWDQYSEKISPVFVTQGSFRGYADMHLAESALNKAKYLFKVEQSLLELRKLVQEASTDENKPLENIVDELVDSGERLLLFHKQLAQTNHAYGFLNQHEISRRDNWDRYNSKRQKLEANQLVQDATELVKGFYELQEKERNFLVDRAELPPELLADFKQARDLFSVGLGDAGLLLVSRGLENVLKTIAANQKLILVSQRKGKIPVQDIDLHKVIEVMAKLEWVDTQATVINKEDVALMHYLREARNGRAHPNRKGLSQSPELTARLGAQMASSLWRILGDAKTSSPLAKKEIQL